MKKNNVNQAFKRLFEKFIVMNDHTGKIKCRRRKLDRLLTLAPSGDDKLVPSLSRTCDFVPYPICSPFNLSF